MAILYIRDEHGNLVPIPTTKGWKGDKVIFEGKVYESIIDGNTWSPTDYPQGWQVV